MSIKDVTLSPGQEVALTAIKDWYGKARIGSAPQVFRMFGPAGTGKTTIARLVPDLVQDVVEDMGPPDTETSVEVPFAAFSGKAANVLRSKGCEPASTLHSLVYGAPVNLEAQRKKVEREIDRLEEERDAIVAGVAAGGRAEEEIREALVDLSASSRWLRDRIRLHGPFEWVLKEESPLATAGLLIADEVSMVNDRMANDILTFGCPVLVLGDPEQLPPVHGEGYFTRADPDITLTEVHRQALDSPVLNLATRVRTEGLWAVARDEYTPGKTLDYTQFDKILCWRRATRWSAIRYLRRQAGRAGDLPEAGDVVMNLVNNKDLGLFNGQSFLVHQAESGEWGEGERVMLTLSEEGGSGEDTFEVESWTMGFQEETEADAGKQRLGGRGTVGLFTHAHALTVHKAQGSEWGKVCLIDETDAMLAMRSDLSGMRQARRWFYTGVTRAAEAVTLVRGRP